MKKTNELLEIIENGDPAEILSEDDLVERLNFLLEWELVDITEEGIKLTSKGYEVKNHGLENFLEKENLDPDLFENLSKWKSTSTSKSWRIAKWLRK